MNIYLKQFIGGIIFVMVCSLTPEPLCAQSVVKFDFGTGPVAKGYRKVLPQTLYNEKTGYGFEAGGNRTAVRKGHRGKASDDNITAAQPFFFSVRLPEGNYNVRVLLGDAKAASATTIKTECRRLMVADIRTAPGVFTTAFFTVHIRDSLIRTTPASRVKLKPRERNYKHWDDKLTLEFNNTAPKVCAVEIEPAGNIPTLFLAGNSTVVDQAEEPWAAWGQLFPAFLKPGVVSVANYAESGETLKAFQGEGRLEKIWNMSKPGDYLFIEFAHNDQKPGENHLDPFTTYKQVLKEWIKAARKRGIIPVLVTSMHRRNFDAAGRVINTLSDYPEAMRQTGKEEQVAVLDLNAMSKVMYEAWGPEGSLAAFVHYPAHTFPNQTTELKDNTHFNTYGAYELAKCIVQAISQSDLPIKKDIIADFKGFDPAHPDPVATFHLPASSVATIVKPYGN